MVNSAEALPAPMTTVGRFRASSIRARSHDLANHVLDRPVVPKTRGQVVEQLGVARHLAEAAEVVGRRDEPAAEEVMPDPVRHHPGRERVLLGEHGIDQVEPSRARSIGFAR